MKRLSRVFVYEYITGGGMMHEPLPESLEREGGMMLGALLRDLSRLPEVALITTRDPRLPPLDLPIAVVPPMPEEDSLALFRRGVSASDLVWPIAPETDGVLERLTYAVIEQRRGLLNSQPRAVRIAASKRLTWQALEEAGIPVAPSFHAGDDLPSRASQWVVKPDDGAGCLETFLFPDREAALAWIDAPDSVSRGEDFILQPYVTGEALSLSLLCRDGCAWLLCVNRQNIVMKDGRLVFKGCEVNALADAGRIFAGLAQRIARALPGLWGYVGVDLILTESGPVVIEINPRLTTSYVGLSAALDANPAEMVLNLLDSCFTPRVDRETRAVAVSCGQSRPAWQSRKQTAQRKGCPRP
jgi:predicted ATP-grasp superfamily ATP-dependent carboligase